MKCEITVDGVLVIWADEPSEPYALAQWYENACDGKCQITLNPLSTLTLGPQQVKLTPLNPDD